MDDNKFSVAVSLIFFNLLIQYSKTTCSHLQVRNLRLTAQLGVFLVLALKYLNLRKLHFKKTETTDHP